MKHSMCPKAIARIRGGQEYPCVSGTVRLFATCGGTILEVNVTGLPETGSGFFAFHIHEGGSCAGEGFPETGSHFNPGRATHPNHAGDLPPLLSHHGRAYLKVFTDRFLPNEIIGKTAIIHSAPDDFHTQPSGNAGTKTACGVIEKV